MLQSFIYKNSKGAKRKTKTPGPNVTVRKGLQSPPSPASFESPQIFDIYERSRVTLAHSTDSVPMRSETEDRVSSYVSDMQAQDPAKDTPSPRVQLEFNTEPLSDWFPMSMLHLAETTFLESLEGGNGIGRRRRRGISGSINGSKSMLDLDSEDRASLEPDLTETSASMYPSSEELSSDRSTPRKGVPAPITIPSMAHHGPKVQVQHTAAPVDPTTSKSSFPRVSPLIHSRPNSEASMDNLSAVSGTTLARALIANSFTLSSEPRTSRYRGVTRQDSTTLPRGEPLINPPYWRGKRIADGEIVVDPEYRDGTAISPVPQVPSVDVLMMGRKGCGPKHSTASRGRSQRGTEHRRSNSLNPQCPPSPTNTPTRSASTGATSPQRVQVRAPYRISRISEAPSLSPSVPSTPTRESHEDQGQPFQESPMLSRNREEAETDVPTTALSMHTDHSRNSSAGLSLPLREDSEAVLDDFLFLSPLSSARESQPSASASSSSSASPKMYSNIMRKNSKRFKGGKIMNTMSSGSSARGSRLEFNLPQVRSESRIAALRSRENTQNRSFALLPIGERPHSLSEPAISSPSTRVSSVSRLAIVPPSNRLSLVNAPNSSPDILDTLLAPVSRNLFVRQRSGSTPNPITVVRGSREVNYIMGSDDSASAGNTPSTGSVGAQQTFPETPSAFSPLWTTTGVFRSPRSLARSPGGSLVSGSMLIVPQSAPLGSGTFDSSMAGLTQKVLAEVKNSSRQSTSSSIPWTTIHPPVRSSASVAHTTPLTPPKEGDASFPANDEARSISTSDDKNLQELPMDEPPSPALSSFEIHRSSPCMESSAVHAAEPSVSTSALQTTPSDTALSSLEPAQTPTPAVTPNSADETSFQPLPPPIINSPERFSSSYSSSPHLSFVPPPPYQEATPENAANANNADAQACGTQPRAVKSANSGTHPLAQFVIPPPPTLITTERSRVGPSQALESPPYTSSASTMGSRSPNSATSIVTGNVTVNGRKTRVRPPLPIGPRKLGAALPIPSSATRFSGRARKASVSSIIEGTNTSDDTAPGYRRLTSIISSPKFSTSPPKWKGHTMEAAKWTFTSHQLQSIVSRAIKQSAQVSYIRLLQLETYDDEIPKEIRQLEQQKAEYKTRYKMLTRKRWTLLGTLAVHAERGQLNDAAASIRLLDTLAEVSATLDKLAEEIHYVTDQLGQLQSLRDIHSGSALAMALRKLNASFLGKATENDLLRKRIAALEAERDEAWKQAEDMAHEFDDLNDKVSYRENSSARSTTSLRSSRVMAVRKSSLRVSKAGLRSSSAMRSQRSSVASINRGSSVPSSAALGSSFTSKDIPPVPPLPLQRSLGIVTADLHTESSDLVSSITPDSAAQALMQAQQELYEMLGIHFTEPEARRPRPRSMSCVVPGGSRLSMQASAPRPTSHRVTSSLPDPVSSKLVDPSYQDREDMLVATLGLFSS